MSAAGNWRRAAVHVRFFWWKGGFEKSHVEVSRAFSPRRVGGQRELEERPTSKMLVA